MHQLLKNIISFCLLLLVISHGIIQFGMFELFRADFRAEAARLIGAGVPEPRRVVLCFDKNEFANGLTSVEWKADDEFRLEGKLYDVIRTEIKGDSVYLYCLYDEDDTILFSVLDSMIEDDSDEPKETDGLGIALSTYYICGNFDYNLESPGSEKEYISNPGINLLEGEYIINTPPPRTAV